MSVPVGEFPIHDGPSLRTWPVMLAVWMTFFLFGTITAPVPGTNEPHYLCKARHFWRPDWCARDFFLASPNAHTVFYATIGGLTNLTTFAGSAWIGRVAATLVLAWGWTRSLSRLFFAPWAALWSAWLFLILASIGNFSGEWLVGGVEAKVFAYALLFAAFGDILAGRSVLAAIWAGLAIAFHPLVGGWGLSAFIASRIVRRRTTRGIETIVRSDNVNSSAYDWRTFLQVLMLILFALPGLIPVVKLLKDGNAETGYAATYIQVYFRLAHHLDPMVFPARAYLGYAALLAVWVSSLAWAGRTNSKRVLDRIVLWTVVFAVAGILIGWGPRPPMRMPFFAQRMQLLKFYPFRLMDILLPLAVAISLVGVFERTLFNRPPSTTWRRRLSHPASVLLLFLLTGLLRTFESRKHSLDDRADWLDVCSWISAHVADDALVQTPTNQATFKWFAQRAEYVTFKDCPQDGAGILEWNRRLNFLRQWYAQNYDDRFYSANELKDLRRQAGLTHILSERIGPIELESIYSNSTYQLYDLQSLDQ